MRRRKIWLLFLAGPEWQTTLRERGSEGERIKIRVSCGKRSYEGRSGERHTEK